jgi:hypothetical protein
VTASVSVPVFIPVPEHYDGRSQHSDGRSKHSDGRSQPSDCTSQHSDGRSQHSDGTSQHSDGTSQHSDGRPQHCPEVPPILLNHEIIHAFKHQVAAAAAEVGGGGAAVQDQVPIPAAFQSLSKYLDPLRVPFPDSDWPQVMKILKRIEGPITDEKLIELGLQDPSLGIKMGVREFSARSRAAKREDKAQRVQMREDEDTWAQELLNKPATDEGGGNTLTRATAKHIKTRKLEGFNWDQRWYRKRMAVPVPAEVEENAQVEESTQIQGEGGHEV